VRQHLHRRNHCRYDQHRKPSNTRTHAHRAATSSFLSNTSKMFTSCGSTCVTLTSPLFPFPIPRSVHQSRWKLVRAVRKHSSCRLRNGRQHLVHDPVGSCCAAVVVHGPSREREHECDADVRRPECILLLGPGPRATNERSQVD